MGEDPWITVTTHATLKTPTVAWIVVRVTSHSPLEPPQKSQKAWSRHSWTVLSLRIKKSWGSLRIYPHSPVLHPTITLSRRDPSHRYHQRYSSLNHCPWPLGVKQPPILHPLQPSRQGSSHKSNHQRLEVKINFLLKKEVYLVMWSKPRYIFQVLAVCGKW